MSNLFLCYLNILLLTAVIIADTETPDEITNTESDYEWLKCFQSKDNGSRRDVSDPVDRYYYDEQQQVCTKFIFRGCNDGQNQFDTQQDCIRICKPSEVCRMPLDERMRGNCDNWNGGHRYAYLGLHRKCKQFYFLGCQGNVNRFETSEDCERTCNVHPGLRSNRPDETPETKGLARGVHPNEPQYDRCFLQPAGASGCGLIHPSASYYYNYMNKSACHLSTWGVVAMKITSLIDTGVMKPAKPLKISDF